MTEDKLLIRDTDIDIVSDVIKKHLGRNCIDGQYKYRTYSAYFKLKLKRNFKEFHLIDYSVLRELFAEYSYSVDVTHYPETSEVVLIIKKFTINYIKTED